MNSTLNGRIYPLTLYYDGSCALCRAEMGNLMLRNTPGLLRFVDAAPPGFKDFPPGTDRAALMNLIHAQRADGQVLSGVEVFRLAYSAVGLPQVAWITRLPLLKGMSEALYPVIARNRHRIPRVLSHLLFETRWRAAAERSAEQANCHDGHCEISTPVATPISTTVSDPISVTSPAAHKE